MQLVVNYSTATECSVAGACIVEIRLKKGLEETSFDSYLSQERSIAQLRFWVLVPQ